MGDDLKPKSPTARFGRARSATAVVSQSGDALEPADDFRAIADFTYDWESWMDPAGNPLWVNPAVERMTGYSVADCMAMSDYPLPLIAEEDRFTVMTLLDAAKQGASGNDVTFRILRKDGSRAWAAVSWQPILGSEGQSLGIRTSVRDITERKKLEEILRTAHEEAMRANTAKSRFLAAASHDLRQPLQAMEYILATLGYTVKDAESQALLRDLGDCLKATSELLGSMLEISRLDAGTLTPKLAEFPIGDLVDQVSREFASLAEEKGLLLRSVHSGYVVQSDPTHLRRILMNLVGNAVRYTHCGRILVACRRRGTELSIEVWDTGEGIPNDQAERIFEEFYQIGNPERDRTRGLGLGLSIVRRMAEQLGHAVSLRSTPGRGSVFTIRVPLVSESSAAVEDKDSRSRGALNGVTILVVDDEPNQLRSIGRLLPHWGCRPILAESLRDAITKMQETGARPELIISDYRLRDGANGAEVIRRLSVEHCNGAPGIILTGDTELSRLLAAAESGFIVVHKPIDPEELRIALEDSIRSARSTEPPKTFPAPGDRVG